jgi:hypothetical protein
MNRGGINAPSAVKTLQKKQNPHQRRQAALQCFLATLPAIGRVFAPDLNRAYSQGVYWDSLENFNSLGALQARETPALRAFFERAASANILYVL